MNDEDRWLRVTDDERDMMEAKGWTLAFDDAYMFDFEREGVVIFNADGSATFAAGWHVGLRADDNMPEPLYGPFPTLADAVRAAEGGEA